MVRAIDADNLKKQIEDLFIAIGFRTGKTVFGKLISQYITAIMEIIDEQPTIDHVKHGKWVDNGIPESILCGCSECGYTCGAYSFNYCPNCGARMDGE